MPETTPAASASASESRRDAPSCTAKAQGRSPAPHSVGEPLQCAPRHKRLRCAIPPTPLRANNEKRARDGLLHVKAMSANFPAGHGNNARVLSGTPSISCSPSTPTPHADHPRPHANPRPAHSQHTHESAVGTQHTRHAYAHTTPTALPLARPAKAGNHAGRCQQHHHLADPTPARPAKAGNARHERRPEVGDAPPDTLMHISRPSSVAYISPHRHAQCAQHADHPRPHAHILPANPRPASAAAHSPALRSPTYAHSNYHPHGPRKHVTHGPKRRHVMRSPDTPPPFPRSEERRRRARSTPPHIHASDPAPHGYGVGRSAIGDAPAMHPHRDHDAGNIHAQSPSACRRPHANLSPASARTPSAAPESIAPSTDVNTTIRRARGAEGAHSRAPSPERAPSGRGERAGERVLRGEISRAQGRRKRKAMRVGGGGGERVLREGAGVEIGIGIGMSARVWVGRGERANERGRDAEDDGDWGGGRREAGGEGEWNKKGEDVPGIMGSIGEDDGCGWGSIEKIRRSIERRVEETLGWYQLTQPGGADAPNSRILSSSLIHCTLKGRKAQGAHAANVSDL
ncbi:hypothetical protein C8J57DRAFT_1254961 [Mycena rebaudengoi]|nr:hypothetical protein C8J57DRAFT_1254961 [Mycena rebaudengoi]